MRKVENLHKSGKMNKEHLWNITGGSMQSYGLTDKGLVRKDNEDHYYRSDHQIGMLKNLYVVADGMGGHKAGAIASRQAVAYLLKYIEETDESDISVLLTEAVLYANAQVYGESLQKNEYQGMGTTLVACTIEDEVLHVVNVGDSRLYVMRDKLEQVTEDHSVVEELYRSGYITEKERQVHPDRNIITRAIGANEVVEVDYFKAKMDGCVLILICSDGLNKMLANEGIEAQIKDYEPLDVIADTLVEGAKELGGSDNITVVLIKNGNEVLS